MDSDDETEASKVLHRIMEDSDEDETDQTSSSSEEHTVDPEPIIDTPAILVPRKKEKRHKKIVKRTIKNKAPPVPQIQATVSKEVRRLAFATALRRRETVASLIYNDDSMATRILLTPVECWAVDVEAFDSLRNSVNQLSHRADLCWQLIDSKLVQGTHKDSMDKLSTHQCETVLKKKVPIARKTKKAAPKR